MEFLNVLKVLDFLIFLRLENLYLRSVFPSGSLKRYNQGSDRCHFLTGICRDEDLKILEDLVAENNGILSCGHIDSVICKVPISMAGLGSCGSRIVNLPREVTNATFQQPPGKYGDVHEVRADIRSFAYRYGVNSGIRDVTLQLRLYISLTHKSIA